jgi:hypothetical protein
MVDYLQSLYEFITSGIYDFFVAASAWILAKFLLLWLDVKIWAFKFCFSVSQEFLKQIDMSSLIHQAFSGLPGDIVSMLQFFRVPEAINILISAVVTRYALRFVPFGW